MSPLLAHTYACDSLDNRRQKDHESYEINALNEVVSHLEYDKNGNPIRQGSTRYMYDALDRVIRIETPDLREDFTYDSLHRCLSKTTVRNGVQKTSYFLYDGQNEIGSFDEMLHLQELRVLGIVSHAEIGSAIAIELQGRAFAPIHDLSGNVAAMIPIDRGLAALYRYSAFGEEKIEGPVLSPWRFSSKRSDAETGLVYYGRRFYMPAMGRWLTPDPAGFSDGMNLYAFVHNDPLTHLDEYGLFEDVMWMTDAMCQQQRENQCFLQGPYRFENYYTRYTPPSFSRNPLDVRPRGEVVLFTGIRNTKEEFFASVQYASKLGGDIPVHGIYMPTFGLSADLENCRITLETHTNSSILAGERYFQEASERVGPNGKILAIGHSAGAMNLDFSAMNLPQEIRSKIIVRAFAPAKIVAKGTFKDGRNFMSSNQDLLMKYHRIFHKDEYKQARNSGHLTKIHAHPDASKFNDHAFMSPTFEDTIRNSMREFVKNYDCW